MAEAPSPDFAVAIAYCLAYDHWGIAPDRGAITRLQAGAEPQSDEDALLVQMLDAARLVIGEPQAGVSVVQHIRQIQEKALAKVALIMGGATKIKQYVFESARLPEIRGASELLDRINRVDLPALFHQLPSDSEENQRAREVRQQFAGRHGKQPPDCLDCIIYANGGELLAFAPTSLAQALADEIELLYTSETLVANSVAVWQPFNLEELVGGVEPLVFWQRWGTRDRRDLLIPFLGKHVVEEPLKKKCFGELAAALAGEKFRRREGNPTLDGSGSVIRPPKSAAHWETFAYGQRCRSCERRLASREYTIADERQALCEACYRKMKMGWELKREWAARFETFLQGTGRAKAYYRVVHDGSEMDVRAECPARRWDSQCLPDRPQDLNEIGQASTPQGYVGVVYADGNNMGALLEQLRNPAQYHHFARAVHEATQGALFGALSTSLHPGHVSRGDSNNKQATWVHPFEILSIGGDDLFLIVPAQNALPIAIQTAQHVERGLSEDPLFQESSGYDPGQVHRCELDSNENVRVAPQSTVGLSVGVLLADAKTPIFFLQELVGQLLKSAKGLAKSLRKEPRYFGGTIDFMALKSVTMITSTLSEFRESTLQLDKVRLTARPYTLLELEKLMSTVRALKRARFPRSQLYALRSALWEGRLASTVNYLYFTERLDPQDRDQIRNVLDSLWCRGEAAPWHRTKSDTWETILFDVIELYEFVEE